MVFDKIKKVLILARLNDDGELCCVGTISKLVENDIEIIYHAFSNAAKSLPKNLPPDTLEKELRNAMDIFGVPQNNVFVHPFEVRTFSYNRQDLLEILVKIRKEERPDLVFLPSTQDIHQDHQVVSQEGIRAFKSDRLLGYELPWNNITFSTHCFSLLEEKHVNKKIEALKCYKTQQHRTYLSPEFIRSLAITRGTQLQKPFAEVFEMIRWILF